MLNCSLIPPPDLTVTSSILSIVLCYIIVFIIAFIGNFTMFLILCRNQWIKVRRVHSLLLQMNIAHLMVTLFYMPKEILHNYTIAWYGGDVLCRTCKFFDVFGIALSMNILICISLDRFYSIFFPLYAMRARKSVQKMVIVAWITSFATSAPQVVFYFSILNIVQVYFFPLIVTVVCYSLILWKISEESSAKKKETEAASDALLRRSGVNTLERARSRTLRMTFVIVVAFICCWTPYAIMMFLHFLTKTDWIPKDVRKFIYAFAVFNSAISPYLYGYFSFDVKKELKLLLTCSRNTASDRHLSCSANVVRSNTSQRIRKRSASATQLVPGSQEPVTPVLSSRGHSLRTAKKPCLITTSATTLSPQTAIRI
ncbi:hypothetical protein RB195_006957 [Necator americanus]